MKTIDQVIATFVRDLTVVVRFQVRDDVRREALKQVGIAAAGKEAAPSPVKTKTKRRKGPIQLCPVPKCGERAAPIYGMVCAKHKGLSKTTIKAYREVRKAKSKLTKK